MQTFEVIKRMPMACQTQVEVFEQLQATTCRKFNYQLGYDPRDLICRDATATDHDVAGTFKMVMPLGGSGRLSK